MCISEESRTLVGIIILRFPFYSCSYYNYNLASCQLQRTVRDVELRSAIIELVSILREMTPAERRYFVDMAQKLQHLMESSSENKAPILIG